MDQGCLRSSDCRQPSGSGGDLGSGSESRHAQPEGEEQRRMTAAKHHTAPVAADTFKAFSATDASVLAGIPALIWPAWFLPERFWPAICRNLSPLAISDLTHEPQAAAELIRRTLGTHLPEVAGTEILRDMGAEGIFTFFQVLKCH